jgi:hypothetical protein
MYIYRLNCYLNFLAAGNHYTTRPAPYNRGGNGAGSKPHLCRKKMTLIKRLINLKYIMKSYKYIDYYNLLQGMEVLLQEGFIPKPGLGNGCFKPILIQFRGFFDKFPLKPQLLVMIHPRSRFSPMLSEMAIESRFVSFRCVPETDLNPAKI